MFFKKLFCFTLCAITTANVIAIPQSTPPNSLAERATLIATSQDCIKSFKHDEKSFKIETKNGKKISGFKDSLDRVILIKAGNNSFHPVYDKNFPQKMLSVRSLMNGAEKIIEIDQKITAPYYSKDKLREILKNPPITMCSEKNKLSNTNTTQAKYNNNQAQVASIGGSPYQEEWMQYDFWPEYITPEYWDTEHHPWFVDAYNQAMDPAVLKSCIDRVSDCNDACDTANDVRGLSCATLTLVFMEIPIAAGIAGLVCMGRSLSEKNKCKNNCPILSSCF